MPALTSICGPERRSCSFHGMLVHTHAVLTLRHLTITFSVLCKIPSKEKNSILWSISKSTRKTSSCASPRPSGQVEFSNCWNIGLRWSKKGMPTSLIKVQLYSRYWHCNFVLKRATNLLNNPIFSWGIMKLWLLWQISHLVHGVKKKKNTCQIAFEASGKCSKVNILSRFFLPNLKEIHALLCLAALFHTSSKMNSLGLFVLMCLS